MRHRQEKLSDVTRAASGTRTRKSAGKRLAGTTGDTMSPVGGIILEVLKDTPERNVTARDIAIKANARDNLWLMPQDIRRHLSRLVAEGKVQKYGEDIKGMFATYSLPRKAGTRLLVWE